MGVDVTPSSDRAETEAGAGAVTTAPESRAAGESAAPPTLRLAQPSDALCVGVLATQVFLDTYATEGIRADLAREALDGYSPALFSSRLASPAISMVLAEHRHHLIGFAELERDTPCPHASLAGGVELVRLYVQRPFQGAGAGTSLLGAAERLAIEASFSSLWLTAWSGNSRARGFYHARGYADIGTTVYVIDGQAYENRIFTKSLTDSSAA